MPRKDDDRLREELDVRKHQVCINQLLNIYSFSFAFRPVTIDKGASLLGLLRGSPRYLQKERSEHGSR